MNDDVDDDLTGPILDPADDGAVTALLANLPDLAIPDDVAERIATALAAEVPLSGAVPAWAAGGASNVSVLPSQRERDQRKAARRARVLSGAAAVVLVLGAVAFGTQFFGGDDGGTGGSGDAATAEGGASGPAPVEATLLSTSNAAYDQADLAPKVSSLVAQASSPGVAKTVLPEAVQSPPAPGPSGPPADVQALTREPFSILAACIAKLTTTPGEQPLAVDTGTWTSSTGAAKPVAVIVLPAVNAGLVDVFVVTVGCADPAVVDDSYLLYFASVARP